MKILVTNDDGIYAEGIVNLAAVLAKNSHEVVVIAPDRERSAAGHSITITEPLRMKEVSINNLENIDCYKVNGTPADCVKLGLEKIDGFIPDIIISGINDGPNLGYDVLYSGTVSAAIEGFILGYTSIAVSLAYGKNRNFQDGALFACNFLDKEGFKKIKDKMLFNINIPDSEELDFDNFKITILGDNLYEDHFEERLDPMGNKYFWLSGEIKDKFASNTDLWTISNKMISITPLKLNLTANEKIDELKNIFQE